MALNRFEERRDDVLIEVLLWFFEMALLYRLNAIVRKGRLAATFLLHDIERDKSYAIDSSFSANLPEGPWEFTTMAAAGDLLCVRGRHPMERDVLMLCSPQHQAWKRLPLCNTVKHLKRVGMSFQKDDHSYKVLAVELDEEKMVTEVYDSKLESWSSGIQQEKEFHKLLGRCEFSHETQEFYHLVEKSSQTDVHEDVVKVYSMIRYKEPSGGWRFVDMNLPARMTNYTSYDFGRRTIRWVRNASLVGDGNSLKPGLKLLVDAKTASEDSTFDFEQSDCLVYEYEKAAGKWQTMFLCSCTNPHYSWKQKANERKYRWFKEGSRWYPAVIGLAGKKNALRVDCVPGSDSESDVGSGEHAVPTILVPVLEFDEPLIHCKRLPRRKLPRGRGDPRMKPSEEACVLMLESLQERFNRIKRFGHGNKVFMVSEKDTRIVMYDCVSNEFSVLHLSEPCGLRKDDGGNDLSQFANWDPVCVDVVVRDPNFWNQHGFSVEKIDSDNNSKDGNGFLVYDMTSMVTGDGRLMVNLMAHDVVKDKSEVINLVCDAGLHDLMWDVEIVAAAGYFLCFRCSHTTHGHMYVICKPACNSWQLLPPVPMYKLQALNDVPTVGLYVDDTQAKYKVMVLTNEETAVFDSEACSWTEHGKGYYAKGCKFDNGFGGFLTLKDRCIATYVTESRKWEHTKILLPKYSQEQQLFGSQDRTLLMVREYGTAQGVVYGVNAKENRLEPILLNRRFVGDVKDVKGATILEELQETETRELVLGATECFGRGDCIFWTKREDERVVVYDSVIKQFKVLHIVKPWGKYKDGHRRTLRELPNKRMMTSCYTHSVYLCTA